MNNPILVTIHPVAVEKPTAAKMLGISERLLMQLVADGELTARKLRSRTVFAVEDLKRYVGALPSWEPQA